MSARIIGPRRDPFLGSIDITPGCWLWIGPKDGCGYGKLGRKLAHRVSWERHNGPLASPKVYVCHSCDTPACVNPTHLFLGSQRDNMADMRLKGRANKPIGESNPRATLTEERVRAIRIQRDGGIRLKHIAAEFGTTISTVYNISKRKTWRHL